MQLRDRLRPARDAACSGRPLHEREASTPRRKRFSKELIENRRPVWPEERVRTEPSAQVAQSRE